MNKETLTALRESIKVWEDRARGNHHPIGCSSCPLCHLFHYIYLTNKNKECCSGCPVYENTGMQSCLGTPYMTYFKDRSNQSAQKEVDFLKSLLPTSEVKEQTFTWVDLEEFGKEF